MVEEDIPGAHWKNNVQGMWHSVPVLLLLSHRDEACGSVGFVVDFNCMSAQPSRYGCDGRAGEG